MDATQNPFMISIYFVTFNLLCGVVLVNVVVAVLLGPSSPLRGAPSNQNPYLE